MNRQQRRLEKRRGGPAPVRETSAVPSASVDPTQPYPEESLPHGPGNRDGNRLRQAVQYHQTGRLEDAKAAYFEIISSDPGNFRAYANLGLILLDEGDGNAAKALFEQAVAIDPNDIQTLNNLGNLCQRRGDVEASLAHYEKALRANPGYSVTYNNLGFLFESLGKIDRAIDYYRDALRLSPDSPEVHLNLGVALQRMSLLDEAIVCYGQAIALRPNFAAAHGNLGVALMGQNKFTLSVAALNEALRFEPNYLDAMLNLGNVMTRLGRIDEAIRHYQYILELQPGNADARSNLLLTLNYPDSVSTQALARKSMEVGAWMERDFLVDQLRCDRPALPGKRLRVGYVSPDFRNHAVASFLEPLIRAHNRTEVEIFCYAEVRVADDVTVRFQSLADHWRWTVGISDDKLAALIRADGIDILIDLAGYSADNRLPVFTRRPAPVQVTWLGYPGTTGLTCIDYRMVDSITDPVDDADKFASETLLRIEGGFLCYQPPDGMPEPASAPSFENGFVTF